MSKLRELLFREPETAEVRPQSAEGTSAPGSITKPILQSAKEQSTTSLSLRGAVVAAKKGQKSSISEAAQVYQRLKTKIHNRLIENLDVNALMQLNGNDAVEASVERTVHILLDEERLPLSNTERQNIVRDVLYETLGLGPLEPLLADPDVNDILVNGAQSVWIDHNGKLKQTDIHFKDDNHLLHVINRIVSRVGRRVDESSPIVDARLPDGSRVNAIIAPLSIDGPILSIRRFRPNPFQLEDLIEKNTLSVNMADFLQMAVQARLNILVSGGTSAGKTTLLNVLSAHISDEERIVTIEDTAELRLQQRHVIRLESRPANIEGQGSVSQRELVKNALRMRPDRIIVGEVRGPEALDMLQAMNTGHEGSLTTVHANSARDALSRLETLVLLGGVELSQRSIREQIGSAFDLVVQIKRLMDGTRRVVSVTEVTGVQEGVISLQDIFEFSQTGLDADGKVIGAHRACGIRPLVEHKFIEAGIELPREIFATDTVEAAVGMNQIQIVAIVLLTAALLGFITIKQLQMQKQKRMLAERLSGFLQPAAAVEEAAKTLLKTDRAFGNGLLSSFGNFSLAKKIENLIGQSGVEISAASFIFSSALLLLLPVSIAMIFQFDPLIAAVVGLVLSMVPLGYVLSKRAALRKKFTEQLPDAIDLMISVLRSGHSIPQAVKTVSEELPSPCGAEFAQVMQRMNLGQPLSEALVYTCDKFRSFELDLMRRAIAIQFEVGGSLAELLDKTNITLRQRLKLVRQVTVLTAQSRLTALVVGLLPLFMAIGMQTINPGYLQPLVESNFGRTLLIVAIVLQVVGIFIMKKMSTVKV